MIVLPGPSWPRSRREFLRISAGSAATALASPFLTGCARHIALPAPVAPPPVSQIEDTESLKAYGAKHRLLYGCAVQLGPLLSDPSYARLVREQASILVAENEMKWEVLRPASTTFNFDAADQLIAFAETNHMKMRGHTLVWHRQLPPWFAAEAHAENARALLTSHIEQVAGRYAGRMHSWDVVNEAISVEDGRPDGLRVTPWLNLLGPEYIELAFRTARDADPQALLAYNDYGIEAENAGDERKRVAILSMLRRMKTRHVPIDAVGIQSHLSADGVYGEGLRRFMAEVRQMGLQIFLSEMDVNDRPLPAEDALRDAAVAQTYGSYLDLALDEPAVRVLLTWGITDRYTWRNGEDSRPDHLPERCLPFDRECMPKSAFFAMRNSFARRVAL